MLISFQRLGCKRGEETPPRGFDTVVVALLYKTGTKNERRTIKSATARRRKEEKNQTHMVCFPAEDFTEYGLVFFIITSFVLKYWSIKYLFHKAISREEKEKNFGGWSRKFTQKKRKLTREESETWSFVFQRTSSLQDHWGTFTFRRSPSHSMYYPPAHTMALKPKTLLIDECIDGLVRPHQAALR